MTIDWFYMSLFLYAVGIIHTYIALRNMAPSGTPRSVLWVSIVIWPFLILLHLALARIKTLYGVLKPWYKRMTLRASEVLGLWRS